MNVAVGVLILLMACSTTKTNEAVPVTTNKNIGNAEKEVVNIINDYRRKKGLSPLKAVAHITDEAETHSSNMASQKTGFGHAGFEQRFDRLKKKIPGVTNAAENVAYGNITTEKIVDGWLHSPGHKKNIEGNYNLTGVGIKKNSKGVLFYTQIFLYQKQ
ncbi:MAG: CAP domain-containing protein [Chitinophagaceae bacterium]|nr:CAP domain-containing protein [Chitinophagaceae bacterium]